MRDFPHRRMALVFVNIWFLIALIALAIWLIGYLFDVVLVIIFSGIIALALRGPTSWVSARIGLPWWVSALIVFIIFSIVLLGLLVVISIPLTAETARLVHELPRVEDAVGTLINELGRILTSFGFTIEEQVITERVGRSLNEIVTNLLRGFARAISAVASAVAGVGAILILSLYFLIQAPAIGRSTISLIPKNLRGRMTALGRELDEIVVRYVIGNLLVSAILGVAVGVGMYFLGLPSPILLGVIAGVLDLIPIFGPILGAVPAVTFALFESVSLAITVVVYFLIVQEVESHLLDPVVFGTILEINPVLIVLALLVGFRVAGIYGALFAIPVLTTLLAVIRHGLRWYFEYTGDSRGIEI